jgi:hypothetical protein
MTTPHYDPAPHLTQSQQDDALCALERRQRIPDHILDRVAKLLQDRGIGFETAADYSETEWDGVLADVHAEEYLISDATSVRVLCRLLQAAVKDRR